MNKRYLVSASEGFGNTLVFAVEDTESAYPYKDIDVWILYERLNCTSCSGPLQAMLSNCPHTNAVRRYLRKEATNEN